MEIPNSMASAMVRHCGSIEAAAVISLREKAMRTEDDLGGMNLKTRESYCTDVISTCRGM